MLLTLNVKDLHPQRRLNKGITCSNVPNEGHAYLPTVQGF